MRLPHPVRAAGARLIGGVPVPVLSGPNAGRLWSLASAGRGYASGRFERDRIASIMAVIRAGDRFWDVGAHKGYVTLAAARRVGRAGRVLAFEPSRRNLVFLRRHLSWNRPRNVEVRAVALADEDGEAAFGGAGSSITYRLGTGDERVAVRRMADVIEEEGRGPPTVLKVDVEGAESRVLAGAGAYLERIQVLFVAVHHMSAYQACRPLLDQAGFEVMEGTRMRRFTAGGEAWDGDADLVAWRPERGLDRAAVASLPGYRRESG